MGMEIIETVQVTSSVSTIEFTGIPQDGVDLVLLLSGRHDLNGAVFMRFKVNNNTSGIYTYQALQGTGSAAEASRSVNATNFIGGSLPGASYTANTFSNNELTFSNYSSSAHKSISANSVYMWNSTSAKATLLACRAGTTAAITSIQITLDSGAKFATNSCASLYKIS
jgi:hypothetical protein